jgi:hypothetical protein
MGRKNCVKKLVFCWHLEGQLRKKQDPDPGSGSGSRSVSQRHGSPDPDPPQNVMDPQHCFEVISKENFEKSLFLLIRVRNPMALFGEPDPVPYKNVMVLMDPKHCFQELN